MCVVCVQVDNGTGSVKGTDGVETDPSVEDTSQAVSAEGTGIVGTAGVVTEPSKDSASQVCVMCV